MMLGLEFEDGQQFRGLKQQLRQVCGLGLRLVDKPFHHLHEVGFQGLVKHEIEVRMQIVSRVLSTREKHYWDFWPLFFYPFTKLTARELRHHEIGYHYIDARHVVAEYRVTFLAVFGCHHFESMALEEECLHPKEEMIVIDD